MSSAAEGTSAVRPAIRADIPRLVEVMTRAFLHEPQFVWLQPEEDLRRRLLPVMFRTLLRHVHPVHWGSQVALAGGGLAGGAVWAPPERWKAPVWRQLLGLPGTFAALDRRNLRGYAKRGKQLQDALERDHPDEPHWYLAALGVDPEAEGTGVGTALMAAGLDRCDAQAASAYLECVERLVPYYERFGFQARGPIAMPDGAPTQVGMWRPPGR
jgi:ribosomal protein S18 acetylase RimI-like enzyme